MLTQHRLRTHRTRWLFPLFLMLALLLAGCGGLGPEATAVPTRTPLPTFTPTPPNGAVDPNAAAQAQAPAQPADQAQPQPAAPAEQPTAPPAAPPTDTPAPPTNTPAPAEVTTNDLVNIRQGPGTSYNIAGSAEPGTKFRVTGKSPDGAWWQIDYNGAAGWILGQLVTASNTEAVAVAQNIPAAPPTQPPAPPTNTPAPAQAQPTPAPAPPARNYEFNIALLQKCEPNEGVTYVEGTVYKNGQPTNGYYVAFSYAPEGPVVATVEAGPHKGYEGWRTGFYSHILAPNSAREGTWFFWVVDSTGKRLSEMSPPVHTDGTRTDTSCQQAVVDFDSR